MNKRIKFIALPLVIILIGYLIPQNAVIPVANATSKDWNAQSFWYYPWGKSGVHKGIDIFAKIGTPVVSSVSGLVIFTGQIEMGGNVVAVLGPKWRLHYYAHLSKIDTHSLTWVSKAEPIGKVGDSGNAVGKPPHLHYSILSLVPNPFAIQLAPQGYMRMFYINPNDLFKTHEKH